MDLKRKQENKPSESTPAKLTKLQSFALKVLESVESVYESLQNIEHYRVYFVGSKSCGICKTLKPDFEKLIMTPILKEGVKNFDFYYVDVSLIDEELFHDQVFPEITQLPHIVPFGLNLIRGEKGFCGPKLLSECQQYIMNCDLMDDSDPDFDQKPSPSELEWAMKPLKERITVLIDIPQWQQDFIAENDYLNEPKPAMGGTIEGLDIVWCQKIFVHLSPNKTIFKSIFRGDKLKIEDAEEFSKDDVEKVAQFHVWLKTELNILAEELRNKRLS